MMIEQGTVLRHRIPPVRHEATTARRHPVEVCRVDKAIADVIVRRHVELRLGKAAHRFEHETGLKSGREVGPHQVHVPFGDEQLDVLELRVLRQPRALLCDVGRVRSRASRNRDARKASGAARFAWRNVR